MAPNQSNTTQPTNIHGLRDRIKVLAIIMPITLLLEQQDLPRAVFDLFHPGVPSAYGDGMSTSPSRMSPFTLVSHDSDLDAPPFLKVP